MRSIHSCTRRELLQASAGAAAVGVMTVTTRANADTPASRPAWTIACRDAHLEHVGEPDVFAAMRAIDVEGVEATVTMDGKCPGLVAPKQAFSIATDDGVKQLGDALAAAKRRISAFCLPNHFDERPDEELEYVVMTTRAAVKLGVPAIRIDVVPRRIKDENEFLKFAIGMGRRIIDATKDTPVRFGVENHGHTTNKPEFLRPLFEGVGDKRFGITLDTANFYWFGHPLSKLYAIYTEFAPWACHTHSKSINYPADKQENRPAIGWEYGKYCCPIYEGDIDFARVVGILRRANYAGDLCIENESLGRYPKEQHRAILRKEADTLRQLAASV